MNLTDTSFAIIDRSQYIDCLGKKILHGDIVYIPPVNTIGVIEYASVKKEDKINYGIMNHYFIEASNLCTPSIYSKKFSIEYILDNEEDKFPKITCLVINEEIIKEHYSEDIVKEILLVKNQIITKNYSRNYVYEAF